MSSVCATPIKGMVFRIVQEDICGNPVTGASGHVIVGNLFTQVQMTPQYEAGTDFFERTADGQIGVNQIDPPILKRMSNQTDLMAIDPDATPYILSARELVTSAPVSGYGFALSEGPSSAHYSFEVWQRVAGAGACNAQGLAQYVYNWWPHCYNTQIAAYTISNARSALSFICDTAAPGLQMQLNSKPTVSGLSYLPASGTTTPGPLEHWMWNITTNTPPTATCGFAPNS